MIAVVFYRHPRKSSGDGFMGNLRATLNKIKNRHKHIIICGDFNNDILKYEHNKYINEFLNTMSSKFLQPCITKPTRIMKYNRPSLVDNIFVNIYDKEIHSGNIIFFSMEMNIYTLNIKKTVTWHHDFHGCQGYKRK